MPERILVVEDEPLILRGLLDALKDEGFRAEGVTDGPAALEAVGRAEPDLVVLDLMLPGLNGFEVLKRLRRDGRRTPVIVLTARGAEEDRLKGLGLGADDYVTKPFSLRELLARVRAVLRRAAWAAKAPERFRVNGIVVDLSKRICERPEGPVELTVREAELLKFLLAHRDRVVTKEELLMTVWQYPSLKDVETRTVDAHMVALRRKVEADPAEPRVLVTVRGEGYRFAGEVEEA